MGGDGGVIAAKRRFMRQGGEDGSSKEKVNEKEQAMERTRLCAITNEPLRAPIVACELGYLYNKDAVISALLEHRLNPAFSHIRGMKDLITIKFTEKKTTAPADDITSTTHVCPVTMEEFNGLHPFVVIKTTGHVVSEKAVKEVSVKGLQQEYGPFVDDDLIRLVACEEDREKLRDRMLARREQAKKNKKGLKEGKKRKAGATVDGEGGDASSGDQKCPAELAGRPSNGSGSGVGNGHTNGGENGELSKKEKKANKKLKKEKEQLLQQQKAASSSAPATYASSSMSSVSASAAEVVKKAVQSSAVLNELLKPSTRTKSADLFITSAGGLRYTLG